MLTANNLQYELSDRTRGLRVGGIGVMHRLARQTGLITAIDEDLHLLKVHLPYHEPAEVVFLADGRGNLENLIATLKNGVHALHAPRPPW